jgi:hypothetical protein
MGGIWPELGAIFVPNRSIRAGENLFAWDSPGFGSLRFASFARWREEIVVMPDIRARASGSNLSILGGQSTTQLCLCRFARGVRAGVAVGAGYGAGLGCLRRNERQKASRLPL